MWYIKWGQSKSAFSDEHYDWYKDSYIHAHISINPPVSDMPFFIAQVKKVQPDAIQFHTHNLSLFNKVNEQKLYEKLNFKKVATINHAGTWYPEYEKPDNLVYRKNADGTFAGRWSRKHLCLNSPGVDKNIIPDYYIDIPEKVKPSQIWIDEAVVTINVCYCNHCVKLYKERYGNEPPVKLTKDNFKEWQQWVGFHRNVFEEWMKKIVDAVHSVDPEILVTFNHSYFIEQPEAPPEFIKNLSADLHSNPLEIGLYSRYGGSSNIPFDIMPGVGSDIWAGNKPKSIEQIYNDISMIIAHGGIWNIGEFPTSFTNLRSEQKFREKGYRPADVYLERAKKGAEFARKRKAYCHQTSSLADAAILHSATTHYAQVIFNMNGNIDGPSYGTTTDGTRSISTEKINSRIYWPNNNPALDDVIGAYEALLENHINFDIIYEKQLWDDLQDYKLLVLPEQAFLKDRTKHEIHKFVKNGGLVIASGSTINVVL